MNPIRLLLESSEIRRIITRISHQILERNSDLSQLALIGIQSRGVYVAKEIQKNIRDIEGFEIPMGVLDNTFYRDDYRSSLSHEPKVTDVPFDVTGKVIILVDDILATGRTIRAALDAIIDLGRPSAVRLVVLVDRGQRELPIRADFVGKKMTTAPNERVSYRVEELDGEDSLWLMEKDI